MAPGLGQLNPTTIEKGDKVVDWSIAIAPI
jgi:hypothetical protein